MVSDTIDLMRRWHGMLDNYNVSEVMTEIEAAITKLELYQSHQNATITINTVKVDEDVENFGLKIDQIHIGMRYRLIPKDGLKKSLHGAIVEAVTKDAGGFIGRVVETPNRIREHIIGNRYHIHAEQVEEYKRGV